MEALSDGKTHVTLFQDVSREWDNLGDVPADNSDVSFWETTRVEVQAELCGRAREYSVK